MSRQIPVEGRLVLSGELTLQSADSIHARLLEMAGQPVIEIDCTGVQETDLSLVQLMLAARASAQQSGRACALTQPATGALLETLRRGGFLNDVGDKPHADHSFWMQTAVI